MPEENGQLRTVTIPVEEYVELVEKANMNMCFNERLNRLEEKFNDVDRHVMNLSNELYVFKTQGK